MILTDIIFILLLTIFLVGCVNQKSEQKLAKNNENYSANYSKDFFTNFSENVSEQQNCSEGTKSGECSSFKPYYCENGELKYNTTKCGCFSYQILEGERCRNALDCNNTKHGECSKNKPFYCFDGMLFERASRCGCPKDLETIGEKCINLYPYDSYANYTWYYKSKTYSIFLKFSKKLVEDYAAKPRTYKCYEPCPSDWETQYYMQFIYDVKQDELIKDLINQMNETANKNSKDEKLMSIMAFVQSIPYNTKSISSSHVMLRYPYETLYMNKGMCGDKTLLAAGIAAKLGYGIALFVYDNENHMALGLKCPYEFSNYQSGYCFLEMTANCSRLTDNTGNYISVGKLETVPRILIVSNGSEIEYNTVFQDVNEIKNFENAKNKIDELAELMKVAKDIDEYNFYVEQYNSYVRTYNAFINCE